MNTYIEDRDPGDEDDVEFILMEAERAEQAAHMTWWEQQAIAFIERSLNK